MQFDVHKRVVNIVVKVVSFLRQGSTVWYGLLYKIFNVNTQQLSPTGRYS